MNTILTDDERFEIWKATETDNRFVLMAEHEAAVLAKLAQQADRQRVPEGWRETVEAAREALETCINFIEDAHIIDGQWSWEPTKRASAAMTQLAAMLTAAPEAPAQASAVDERDRKDAERWRKWISGQSLTVVVPTPTDKNPESKTTIVYSPNPYSGFAEAMNRAIDAALAQKGGDA